MQLLKKSLVISLSSLFLACATPKEKGICYSQPDWVINLPYSKDKVYGVGIAKENINGENAQRVAAISRAVREIAMQLKVKVRNAFFNRQNSNGYNYSDSITFQTVDNQLVKAKVVKMCKNPNNGTLYVLMESDKR